MASSNSNADPGQVPRKTGMLDANGLVVRIWYLFFRNLSAGLTNSKPTVLIESFGTAGTQTITTAPPPTTGNPQLVVIIRLTGAGVLIQFDTGVFDNTVNGIDSTINTQSVFTFIGNNGKWLMLSYTTGKPISA